MSDPTHRTSRRKRNADRLVSQVARYFPISLQKVLWKACESIHCRQSVASFSIVHDLTRTNDNRCFLAVKYGSAAMMKVNPSKGKNLSGGSIILTASGVFYFIPITLLHIYSNDIL